MIRRRRDALIEDSFIFHPGCVDILMVFGVLQDESSVRWMYKIIMMQTPVPCIIYCKPAI